MKVLVCGGTGFVGRALVRKLSHDGHGVVVLTRDRGRAEAILPAKTRFVEWKRPTEEPPPENTFEGVGAVVNLAGESIVDKRWTSAQKALIRQSRVDTTKQLLQGFGLGGEASLLSVWVNASAIGYYATGSEDVLTEGSPSGSNFLSQTCQEWESIFLNSPAPFRKVVLRIGIVLGRDGGLVRQLEPLARRYMAAIVGSGKQWMSWVSLEDLVRIVVESIQNPNYEGVYNATAPNPIRHKDFVRSMARLLRRPVLFRAPKSLVRTALGERSSLALDSQRIVSKKLAEQGFVFRHEQLEEALRSMFPDYALKPKPMSTSP